MTAPRLRITFVAINYAPSVGGVQLLTQRLAEGLTERHGHEVSVITTDALRAPASRQPGKATPPIETINGVRVRRYPYARRTHAALRFARRLRVRLLPRRSPRPVHVGPVAAGPLGLRMLVAVWRACRNQDVVVGISAPYLTLVLAALVPGSVRATRVGVPLVHHSTGASHSAAVLRALRRFDTTIALTGFEAAELEALGVEPGRLETITPGCDAQQYPQMTPTQARAALGLPERPTIGYVGRFASYKGVDTVLAAAPEIVARRPDTTVLLAGTPMGWTDFASLRTAAASAIGDRLLVRENFTEEEKGMLLACCEVVMTPSREESFGIVNIEAWAAGRPVVAGDIPAVRSLVNHGSDGLLVPVGDAPALAREVIALLEDPEVARAMGARGHQRAVTEFGWEAIVDQWDDVIRRTAHAGQCDRTAKNDRDPGGPGSGPELL